MAVYEATCELSGNIFYEQWSDFHPDVLKPFNQSKSDDPLKKMFYFDDK